MAIRPIDIARRHGVSTSMLRHYEALGLLPKVPRSAAGYRQYTPVHAAYFACARGMQPGFTLLQIAEMLGHVMAGDLGAACWLATRAIAELQQEKVIADRIEARLVRQLPETPTEATMTVHQLSLDTGIPASTLRYWDSVGLLPAARDPGNRYRLYNAAHARLALMIYALKLSTYASHGKFYVEQTRESLARMDPTDTAGIAAMVETTRTYLDGLCRARLWAVAALRELWEEVGGRPPAASF